MKKLAVIAFAMIVAASVAMAGALSQFKAGDISFSVLDKDGATPMQSASIKALDATSGDVVAEVVADDLGQAVLALDSGRYLLNVSDVNLAIFDVDASEGLSLCRVIMPDTSLLAGGQEADGGEGVGAASGSGLPAAAVAVGAIVVVAAIGVGIWAIVENNDDDDHKSSDQKVEVAGTQTKSAGKSSSKKKSSSSSEAAQPTQPVNPSAR